MASNRFRYPPAPGNGAGTFSDNLVGNQITDGSSQMTMGNFSIEQEFSRPQTTGYELGGFSSPITLDSLNLSDLAIAKSIVSNNIEIFINNDTSDLSSFVLYGSLKKRLSVATQNIVNFFPGALFVDGVNANFVSGNTTAYNISYDSSTQLTTFKTNVNVIDNPFLIEFTTNGNLLDSNLTKDQILNNIESFGYTADTITDVADGTVSKLRNLTKEFEDYAISFNGGITEDEYTVVGFKPQNINNNFIELTVSGAPFGTISTTTTSTFYIKPNKYKSQESFDGFKSIEAFLMDRNVSPEYTATFKVIKETENGTTYYDEVRETWPKQDNINIDISTSAYTNYLTSLANLGDELDNQKTNLVSRFLTAPILKEFDTPDQKVEKTLQIYGRSFDDIKTYVDGIAYMTNVTYDSKKNIPNELLKNFARTLGWSTPTTLDNKGFLDSVLGVSTPQYSGSSVSMTPAELDIELYRRILMNTAYLFKSKGTRKSIEFLLSLLGAPEALVEFNEYVVLADAKLNMKRFEHNWKSISGGSYTTSTIKYSIPFSQFYIETGTTSHPFVLSDYPVDEYGYPTEPRETNNYFFQRGAGWFERTEEHKSELTIDTEKSTLSGCTPVIKNKFTEFTWGGFWTMGQYSNNVKSPYLDRFRRLPHMSFGFGLTRVIDDKKSWVNLEPGIQTRDYTFNNRDAYYQTSDERLVLNVKNVELSLNIGQALAYDVWQQSVHSDCLFSGGTLPSPYPSSGVWDSTNPKINAKKYDFKTFHKYFWRLFVDAKNRMTINDGKTGGYPVLQKMYLDYLKDNCGENNKYTYQKMVEYSQAMGDYWIKLVEQMVPATTLWTSGLKVQNSVFHRDKFVYRCFSLSGTVTPSVTTANINIALSGFNSFPAPQLRSAASSYPPPTAPQQNTARYTNILSGLTVNPVSSYANSFNINNRGSLFGSEIVSEETNVLANMFHSNKREFTVRSIFTKQGSTDNLLCVYGLKPFGNKGVEWVDTFDLNQDSNGPTTNNVVNRGNPRGIRY